GEGAHATSGPLVVTTQLDNFGDELGEQMIVSQGYELADVGVPIQRAITGGTDEYSDARGELTQRFLGLNASEGFNLNVEMKLTTRYPRQPSHRARPEESAPPRRALHRSRRWPRPVAKGLPFPPRSSL